VYVPIAGSLESNAIMQLDDHELGAYFAKHPKVYQVRGGVVVVVVGCCGCVWCVGTGD